MKPERRKFVKDIVALVSLTGIYPLEAFSFVSRQAKKSKIDSIELFRYDINIPRYFSWGTWHNRQHLFMKISSGNYYGWSEIPASKNNPDFNPVEWIAYLKEFKGLNINEAENLILSQQTQAAAVSTHNLEFIEMGLLDLVGRIENRPAIDLLGLSMRDPVPGLFCILQKDIEEVKARIQECLEQKLNHLKFKMYGDKELDLKLLQTIRQEIGNDAIVISDVNKGYKEWDTLEELAQILNEFKENGLNAVEDPAHLETSQWIQLQELIGELSLIPDYPLRPSWEGLNNIKKGMGKVFNIHPSVMGSLKYSVELANIIESFGAKLMIGDDSLVGPACTAWQQIAIGTGASWVEAIEKKGDSDQYFECVNHIATKAELNGTYSLDPQPGFGLELNEEQLKNICADYIKI